MSNSSNSGMTHADMLTGLSIQNGQLTASPLTIALGDFPASIDALIAYCFGGQTISIASPSLVADHGASGGVEISGTCDFLSMPGLPVTLYAKIEDTDQIKMDFSFALIGSTPDPVFWKLSKSVPGLARANPAKPISFNRKTGITTQETHRPLDELKFYETSFWVTNRESHVHPDLSVDLEWGTNFVSMLIPEGPLATIKNLLGHTNDLKVSGTIRKPRVADTTDILTVPYGDSADPAYHPWELKDDFEFGLPGAHLKVHLGINYSILANEVDFAAEYLNIYMPYNESWSVKRTLPTFAPQQAYSGSVTLPNSSISMDFNVPFDFGVDFLAFNSRFEGFSLSNLSEMMGLAGQNENLMGHLPAELQSLTNGLGALSLEKAFIDLDYRNMSQIHVPSISFRIGMPDVTWDIWEGHFSVGSFWAQFDIQYPFQVAGTNTDPDQQRKVELTVGGAFQIEGVDFNLKASSTDNFSVFAEMAPGNTIPLGNILTTFGDGIDNPGDLTIDTFRLAIAPGKSYNLAMAMNQSGAGWGLEIGPQTFTVSDVYANLGKSKGQSASASIGGALTLGNLGKIDIDYDSPGDISIVSYFDRVNLGDLIETLVGNVIDLPDGFDFDLERVNVIIQKESGSYKFQIASEIDEIGTLAMIVNKVNGKWGVAFGIETYASKLSELPGLSALDPLDGLGAPDSLLAIVSNIERPNFRFPALSQFNNPEINSNQIPVPASNGLTDGLNLYASWSFGNGNQGINTLLNLLGVSGALDVTVSIPKNPANGSRLYLGWDGKILNKYDLNAQFGLQLTNGKPEVFLGGTMVVPIQGNNCTFDIALSVLTTGIYFSGSMQGTISFEGFQLSNLGVMFGYNWALIPSFGVMCTIDTPKFHTSVALLFDSGDPSKSVLAGAISDISLKEVTEEIAKASAVPAELTNVLETISVEGINEFDLPLSLAASLDDRNQATVAQVIYDEIGLSISSDSSSLLIVVNDAGKKWSLTDVRDNMKHYELEAKSSKIVAKASAQLYLAPQGIQLGGFIFNQGFRVMGALSILGLTWTTDIEISNQEGIAATSYLDDDLVILNKDFFKLSDTTGQLGPRFSMATYRRPEQAEPMFQAPHFILDGKLTLLGITTEAYVKFNSTGFEFAASQKQGVDFDATIFSGSYDLDWSLDGGIDMQNGITMGGDFFFDLNGKFDIGALLGGNVNMGKVSVGFRVDVEVDASYDGSNAKLDIDGSFHFGGTKYEFDFSLNANTQGITKLAQEVFREIKEVFTSLYDTAAKWIGEVGDSLEDLGDSISTAANVLGNHFQQGGEMVAEELQQLGAGAERIASELVNNALVAGEEALARILDDLGFDTDEIAAALKSAYNTAAETMTRILTGLKKTATQIGNVLRNLFNTAGDLVGKFLKLAGHAATQIGEALRDVFRYPMSFAAQILNNIGSSLNEIAGMIKSVFSSENLQSITNTLSMMRYAISDIAAQLKNTFNVVAEHATRYLRFAGAAVSAIADALKNIFKVAGEAAAKFFKNAGFAVQEAGEALYNVFKTGADDAGSFLKKAGFNAKDIAKALKKGGLWGKGVNGTGKILKKIGYGKNSVRSALKSAGWSNNAVDKAIKSIF